MNGDQEFIQVFAISYLWYTLQSSSCSQENEEWDASAKEAIETVLDSVSVAFEEPCAVKQDGAVILYA
jgi:hypothetical protein